MPFDNAKLNEHTQLVEESYFSSIVEEELAKVLKGMNISGDWVYGDDKPSRSKPGSITTTFPGIGFGGK